MRPPAFWDRPPDAPGWKAHALAPLGALYAAATRRRVAARTARGPVPVLSVGNLTAGGTGKTPAVIALALALASAGQTAHVVLRGYGGRVRGPLAVDPAQHDAGRVGDEALLLVAFAPTWVAADRKAGVQAAAEAGASLVLLDDGHQASGLIPDLAVLAIDAEAGFGNGHCIPAGPLREPVAAGLARTDAAILIGESAARARFQEVWGAAVTCPVIEARLEPLETGMRWQGARIVAVAGIARPERFFAMLEAAGATLVERIALDDHQPFGPGLLARLDRLARETGARIVMTEKDAVRLQASWRHRILTFPVRLVFERPGAAESLITRLGLRPPV